MMTTLLTILFSLIGLGVLIIVHELGHLIAAKKAKMKIEAFGIGFGRPIFSFRVKDVPVHISWIPFGGFVKIAGMEDGKEAPKTKAADGFFAKTPLARMGVAVAGPLANLLFCLLAFFIVWVGGGRTKPFSFATNRIGVIDEKSTLYAEGVRSGDSVLSYGGQSVAGGRDHLLLATTAIGPTVVETESLVTKERKKITCLSYPNPLANNPDLKTFGVLSPASFLVWMPEQATRAQDPFKPFDRILWVNGKNIFSLQQLKAALNQDVVYLTVRRGDALVNISSPRCRVSDLKITQEVRGELTDWMFEGGLEAKKISSLFFIPYNITQDCRVEGSLEWNHATLQEEQKLLPGDSITALWGEPVSHGYEIVSLLQRPAAAVIVERGFTHRRVASPVELDQLFSEPYRSADFTYVVHHIGAGPKADISSSIELLPRVPLFTEAEVLKKNGIDRTPQEDRDLYLGLIGLQDVATKYNPSPLQAVQSLFEEITSTLGALFSGTVSPKLMSGPVGIVQLLQQQWAYGLFDVLFWLGAISFNLALINLLPLPVLDGGYIFMSLFEILTFRKISSRISSKIITPFAFLLIALLIYLTYHDIMRLIASF